jgi:mannosylglucosylglycerate synthase
MIEHAIELVRRLDDPRAQLVVTHGWHDEGDAYLHYIRQFAKMLDVPMKLVHDWVGERRHTHAPRMGHKQYTLADVYHHADLVTYPSEYEGFGNGFLETVYYRKPAMCNRYSIYRTDIEPKGFEAITMDGFVTNDTVEKARAVLEDRSVRRRIVEHNYELGRQFFSYTVLERKLQALLTEIVGVSQ